MTKKETTKQEKTPYLSDINVAVIMDTFTYNSYKSEFNLFVLEPDNWEQIFNHNKIDIFFCESAWRGVGRENIIDGNAIENDYKAWGGLIAVKLDAGTGKEKTLFDIIDYCNEKGIPTVFWNKEDPPSFDRFIDVALKFDYIFTTDEECIKKYEYMGHENVFPLLFASQTKMFNPIEQTPRSEEIIFAGSWPNKYLNRCADMHNIFQKVLKAGYKLKIYDRNSEKEDTQYRFPEEYQEYVYPKVEHYQIPQVYKEGKIGININTIQHSNTMFARRIFELMSSNTFVITNYSKGVYDLFKDNVVYLDKEESFNVTEEEIDKLCEHNLYDVLENHTYTNRFKYLLDCIGFEYKEKHQKIHVFYIKDENTTLQEIKNDFKNIEYYYKYCKIITDDENIKNEDNLEFLTKDELYKLTESFTDEDYFIIRNMKTKLGKFIEKARLHYQYIEKNTAITINDKKYTFNESDEYENRLFNSVNYKKVLENKYENKKNTFKTYNI